MSLDNIFEKERSGPVGAWRKKYACRKRKGPHLFALVKPKFAIGDIKIRMSVGEYYDMREQQDRKDRAENKRTRLYWFGVMYYWQCESCGKESYSRKRDNPPRK